MVRELNRPGEIHFRGIEDHVDVHRLWIGRAEFLNHFVHAGIKPGDRKRLFEKWARTRILAHDLIVGEAAPAGVHSDLGTVRAAMKCGRGETRRLADDLFRNLGQYIYKPLLISGIDMENIDEDDHFWRDYRGHRVGAVGGGRFGVGDTSVLRFICSASTRLVADEAVTMGSSRCVSLLTVGHSTR